MKTINEMAIMKSVKTYICMFLMIMGICANAWGGITISPMNLSFSGVLTDASVTPAAKQLSCTTTDAWWSVYFTDAESRDYENINWVHVSGDEIVYDVDVKATYGAYVDDNFIIFPSAQTIQANVSVTAVYAGTERIKLYAQINNDNFDLVETKEIIIDVTITEPGTPHNIMYYVPTCASNNPSNESNVAAGTHALPTNVNVEGYTFAGWTENGSYVDGTSAPTTLYTSSFTMPGDRDVELYAVYSKSQSIAASAITWSLTDANPIVAGNYVISNGQYATGAGTNKVMDNEMTSRGSRIAAKDITMSANKITSEVTSVAWQFAKSGDYWTIYNPYAKKYVAATANEKEATLVSSVTDAALWTITKSSSTYNIISKSRAGNDAKYLKFNSSSNAWGCYSTNSAIFLYKTDVDPFEGTTTYTINPQCATYSITYNANGGSGSVPTDATKYAQGATAIVLGNVNGMTKSNSIFAGWATSSSATVAAYHSGSELEIGTSDVVLYAVWTPVVTITYKDQGDVDCTAENIDDLPSEHITNGGNTALVVGTKTNYLFRGWYLSSTCDGDAVTEIASATNTPVTLYAKWEARYTDYRWKCDSYTVTYHDAEGERTEEVDNGNNPVGMDARACSDVDRVFVGWSETAIAEAVQAEPTLVDPTDFTITADKHFYAVYASRNGNDARYTENFEGNSALTWNTEYASSTDATSASCAAHSASHYAQMRNSSDHASSLATANKIANLKKVSYYAMPTGGATGITCKVQYSTNGTDWTDWATAGTMTNQTYALHSTEELVSPMDAYVRILVSNSGSTLYYLCVDDINIYTSDRDWYYTDYSTSCEKAASTTLTYDAQGGTEQTSVTEAGWVTLPTGAECEKGCSILSGWTCSATSEVFEPGTKYLFNHDVTMTAIWSVNTEAAVTVTYHTGLEGATTQTVSGVHCGDILTDVQVPTPTGCGQNVFAGWAIGEFDNTDNLSNIAAKYVVGTDAVMGDMELHAIWQNGKSNFTKYTDDPTDFSGTYIIVDPTSSKALSATLAPTPVTIVGNTIATDEAYIQWEITKVGDQYSIHGLNGYLNITADKTRATAISDAVVDTWNIAESSTNGVYNIGLTFGGSDRRVCYVSKYDKWYSYKNRTSGNLYKLTGDGPSVYTMDGVCPHIYHATGIGEMTSGPDVSVLAAETGMVIVENTSVVPVAQKVSGEDVFEVTVNETPLGANGDGSLNYSYSVKFTPTAGNQTYTAMYKFIGTDETEDEKHIASELITFTGYSLPDQFAIVVKKGEEYYALPGNVTSAGNPDGIYVDVIDNSVMGLGAENLYQVYTGTTDSEVRTTVRLKSPTGALWATNATGATYTINDYNGTLTGSTNAATSQTQWTLERYYRESDDDFLGYHLISDANDERGLFFNGTASVYKWGYYPNNHYGSETYRGDILFLPVVAEKGDKMDIVDWTSTSVTLNMNGYGANSGKWGVKNASDVMLRSTNREDDRTLVVSTPAQVVDKFVKIQVYGDAETGSPVVESENYYKVPHIYTSDATISSPSAFNANSIIYVKSGKLTINTSLTINKVIVNPGAELVIANGKTLKCRELVLRTEPWSAAVFTNHGTRDCSKVYYTRRGHSNKFQQFALPYECLIENVRLSNGVTPAYAGTGTGVYTIRRYDCAKRATNGIATGDNTNWETLTTGTIAAHTGYGLSVSNSYYREFYFPVSITDITSVNVVPHTSSRPSDANWNFICSPLTSRATLNQTAQDPADYMKICEMVDDDEIYWQHVPSTINPVIPFYYQAPSNQTLEFSVSSTVAARRTDSPLQTQWLKVVYENASGIMDETNLYINTERFTADYDMGYDEAKMKSTSTRPQIYTQLACGDLAFAAIPDSMFLTPIPLAVYSPAEGEYTFSLEANEFQTRLESVLLIDTETGAQIDLMDGSYSATVPQGTTTNRFYLQGIFLPTDPIIPVDPGLETGLELQSDGQAPKKVFYQQKLYILRGEHIYDGTGKQVK